MWYRGELQNLQFLSANVISADAHHSCVPISLMQSQLANTGPNMGVINQQRVKGSQTASVDGHRRQNLELVL